MAAGRKERSVEELYNATEVIGELKITPVLRGSYRMQGPVEETEQDIEKNMLPLEPEKTFGKRSMRRKVRTRAESGTCNVCSAPCSSCMHLKLACMGSKCNEFSDETCHETAASQNSINEDELSCFKNRAYDSLRHTVSEASNLPSVNSSHDSLSENVESKASIRCSDIVDPLVESERLPKLSSGGTVVVNQPFPIPQSILDEITSSNKNEYPKVVEGRDDSISCDSRANDTSIAVSHHNMNVDRKNLSCSSALVSSLVSEGTGKAPISPKSELLEKPSGDAYAGSSSLKVQSRCLSSTTSDTYLAEQERKINNSKVSCQLAEGTGKTLNFPDSEMLETPSNDAYTGCSSLEVQSRCLASTTNGIHVEEDTKFDSSKVSNRLLERTGTALVLPKSESLETPLNDAYAGSSSEKVQSRCLSTANGTESEEDRKFETSNFSRKLYPKVEEGTKKDSGDQLDEGIKCSNQVEQDEKSNGSVELPDMQEPALQSVSGNESDESEILEHDVKVCDICGDAGREDLLAICSKCSDGAEHTYCMREMLEKVPEGDWLCEECKLAEETENQRQDGEAKPINKASAPSSGKRHLETMEVTSTSKRQAIETSSVLPKPSSPSRTAALSRDSSFKGSDKGKVKPAHPISFLSPSSVDSPETIRSAMSPRIQTPKGTLLKSNSFNTFNSKPKVKLVDEVPQKQKGSREGRPLDVKEGTARMISKSMSFRSVNSGRSSASDAKTKMLSSKFSQAQDIKALKQVKERNAFESKSSSKLDRPVGSSLTTSSNVHVSKVSQKLTPRGDSVMSSSTSNNKESNASQCDGKMGSLSRTSSIARKGAELPVTSVRSLPANGTCSSSVEQKLNQVSPKDEPSSSSSWTVERPYYNVEENAQDGLSRSRESSNQSEKTREISISRSRPAITAKQKNITCQRCKEIGHAAEFCTGVRTWGSGIDASVARTFRGDMGKGNKLKAAIEAAMLKKPEMFRKKKESDQCDGLSSSNVDASATMASHNQFSVSNKTGILVSDEGTEEGQANLGTSLSENYKQTNNNKGKQLNVHPTDAVFHFKAGDLDPTVSSIGKPSLAFPATPLFSKMLTIPEHEYIWQGAFEVCRGGKTLDLYGGIQAHLSACASPKVLEVVSQFPQKITLDEVHRLSTWPRQFHDNGAKEDNIALYFFAKDLESYEKSYKSLLDNMIKRDLVLKGYFDGVEFLIFPSTRLPENSQCWNSLFFLWGVFRGRRSNCSGSLNKLVIPGSNVVPWDLNSSDKPYNSSNGDLDNKVLRTKAEQQDGRLDSTSLSKNATDSAFLCPGTRSTSLSKEVAALPESRLDIEDKPFTRATSSDNGFNSREETKSHLDASCIREDSSSVKVSQVGDQGVHVRGSTDEHMVDIMVDSMDTDRDEAKIGRNLNKDSMRMDAEASSGTDLNVEGLDCWQSSSRKRSYFDISETAPQIASSAGQKMIWDAVDGESISKKLKTGFYEQYGCSSLREETLSDGIASQICDLGCSSSIEEKSCEKAVDEKVVLEDMGTTERYFFPVDSRRGKEFRLGGNSTPTPLKDYSSNDDGVPNLELALGAETKTPNRGILPFFVGMGEKNNTQNKTPDNVTDKGKEDDVSASLSLSLSFPFPEEEQTVKPVSKTEQLLHERPHVNTSLLLFGGFSDK